MQPAGLRSIRWQLPLTYALIAFVSAVALGVLLIGLLRQYYAQQEYSILDNMSMVLAGQLGVRLNEPLNDATLANIPAFSIPPDYRIEFFDPDGKTVFDTGVLNTVTIEFSSGDRDVAPIVLPQFDGIDRDESAYALAMRYPTMAPETAMTYPEGIDLWTTTVPNNVVLALSGGSTYTATQMPPTAVPPAMLEVRPLNAQELIFTDYAAAVPSNDAVWRVTGSGQTALFYGTPQVAGSRMSSAAYSARSSASITRMIENPMGEVFGYVRLSNPPAIGSALIDSVTSSAVVAGAGAVLIAAILGWMFSLNLTRPLLALTDATARMTQGDLSARVDVQHKGELGALSASFNGMADKVEMTVATLRRFAADAAHELHTPLTAIKTNLELARERPGQDRLALAMVQIDRLEALADDLLDLSRLEMAEAPKRESVDVGVLVRELSEIYASRAEQAGVDFALNMSGTMPPVEANANLLRRAIGNLLDNAVKFTPSGGDVLLAARPGRGTLELIVEDSGIGIPPEDLPVLFSRFHRGSNTASYPGSGLGLAIVKAIADVHQGTVLAENTRKGARFVLKLPASAALT